jgi:deazaflavin-dependent oxidoreductase (nitroreductase family)
MTDQASTSAAESVEQRFFRTLNWFVEPAVRAGLGTSVAGPGAFVLETTGRQSGLPRRVPLLGTRVGDTIVVSTTRAGSQWIRNVEHHPVVDVWVAGRRRRATANVVRLPGGAVANLRLRPCTPTRPGTTEGGDQ